MADSAFAILHARVSKTGRESSLVLRLVGVQIIFGLVFQLGRSDTVIEDRICNREALSLNGADAFAP